MGEQVEESDWFGDGFYSTRFFHCWWVRTIQGKGERMKKKSHHSNKEKKINDQEKNHTLKSMLSHKGSF